MHTVEIDHAFLLVDSEGRKVAELDVRRLDSRRGRGWRGWLERLRRACLRLFHPRRATRVIAAQVARVHVDRVRFLVVMPVTDAERDALRESIGALSARERGFGVLVERDAPGRATVQVTGGDPARAASAVAVVKASWGWDEASLFEIQIGPELLEVRASYEGARWVADVRDGAGS